MIKELINNLKGRILDIGCRKPYKHLFISNYIYKVTFSKNPFLRVLITFLFISPINIIGVLLSLIFPRNNGLYLDNIILAKKVRNG